MFAKGGGQHMTSSCTYIVAPLGFDPEMQLYISIAFPGQILPEQFVIFYLGLCALSCVTLVRGDFDRTQGWGR